MAKSEATYRAAEAALWASVGVTPTERFLNLKRTGTTVRAQTVGSGDPVVFIHGGSNAGTSWADLVARLPNRRCIVVDRPGCGLSPRLAAPHTDVNAFADFAGGLLADVLDALDLETADVIGTSFGGYFSIHGVGAIPDRVRHLVLLGYSVGVEFQYLPPMMRMSTLPGLGPFMARMPTPKPAIKPMLRQIGLKGSLASGRFTQHHIDWFHALLANTDSMINELRDSPKLMTAIKGFNPGLLFTDQQLARVTTPTLILWGRDDPMGNESVAAAFNERFPSATLEMVDGGHAAWIDHPDEIATRVEAFLAG